jgi:ElaB/YqjD/DUF883 family membrane-anchored ribosome-binding protein
MAREPHSEAAASAPDLSALMADLATLRAEVARLAARASAQGEAVAEEIEAAAEEARAYAGRKAKEADQAIHAAVVDSPWLALGIAAGLGLLLGALLRR